MLHGQGRRMSVPTVQRRSGLQWQQDRPNLQSSLLPAMLALLSGLQCLLQLLDLPARGALQATQQTAGLVAAGGLAHASTAHHCKLQPCWLCQSSLPGSPCPAPPAPPGALQSSAPPPPQNLPPPAGL
jgi:hypothetical protein